MGARTFVCCLPEYCKYKQIQYTEIGISEPPAALQVEGLVSISTLFAKVQETIISINLLTKTKGGNEDQV